MKDILKCKLVIKERAGSKLSRVELDKLLSRLNRYFLDSSLQQWLEDNCPEIAEKVYISYD